MATFEHYALVIPEGYNQLTFHHTQTGVPDELIVTHGVGANAGGISQSELDAVRVAYETHMLASMSTAVALTKVTASDAGGVVLESFSTDTGNVASAYGPVSNAVLVEKRSGLSGRRNRGRMYMMWAAEASIDAAGNVDATLVAGLQTAVNNYLGAVEAALFTGAGAMYILHSKGWNGIVEPADPGNAPAPTQVTNLIVRNKIGTQRRRIR